MRTWLAVIAAAIAAAVIGLYLLHGPAKGPVAGGGTSQPKTSVAGTPAIAAPQISSAGKPAVGPAPVTNQVAATEAPAQPAAVPPSPVVVPQSPEGQPTDIEPQIVLENMRRTIRQFGSMFGGNPVGTNPEITRALAGDNPKHINFLKADGNRVNAQGELVDPWGTPYFFHQLSGTEMEVRSAGPDRKLWTSDDLVAR